jgi:hypothetical protein
VTRAAVIGACALALAGGAAAADRGSAGARASLHVLDMQPLVVRGTGFESGERVQLLLSTGEGQVWRAKVAGTAGGLTARFGVAIGGCGRFSVFAHGSRGSRARLLPRRSVIDCVAPTTGGATTHGDSGK